MEEIEPSFTNILALADRLRVLTEPNRLLILHFIMNGIQFNCDLGTNLSLAPNLISHHLRVLREASLVEAERDPVDSRWMYYSINRAGVDELKAEFAAFFHPVRIQPRHMTCHPKTPIFNTNAVISQK